MILILDVDRDYQFYYIRNKGNVPRFFIGVFDMESIKIVQMNGNLHAQVDINLSNLSLKVINRNESVKEVHFHSFAGLENAISVLRIYKSLFHFGYHKHEICNMIGVNHSHLCKIVSAIKPNEAKSRIRKYLGDESKRVLNRIV